jgi:hypothetical protein
VRKFWKRAERCIFYAIVSVFGSVFLIYLCPMGLLLTVSDQPRNARKRSIRAQVGCRAYIMLLYSAIRNLNYHSNSISTYKTTIIYHKCSSPRLIRLLQPRHPHRSAPNTCTNSNSNIVTTTNTPSTWPKANLCRLRL